MLRNCYVRIREVCIVTSAIFTSQATSHTWRRWRSCGAVVAEALSRPQRFLRRKIRSKSVTPLHTSMHNIYHVPNCPTPEHVEDIEDIPCLSSVTKEATLAVSDPRLQNAEAKLAYLCIICSKFLRICESPLKFYFTLALYRARRTAH